jgi:hypothetical protein
MAPGRDAGQIHVCSQRLHGPNKRPRIAGPFAFLEARSRALRRIAHLTRHLPRRALEAAAEVTAQAFEVRTPSGELPRCTSAGLRCASGGAREDLSGCRGQIHLGQQRDGFTSARSRQQTRTEGAQCGSFCFPRPGLKCCAARNRVHIRPGHAGQGVARDPIRTGCCRCPRCGPPSPCAAGAWAACRGRTRRVRGARPRR